MGRVLSIEINNRNVKILEGSRNGSSISILQNLFINIEPGSIDDGRIIEMDSVASKIESVLKDNNVKTKSATFIISTNSTITRNIDLPLLKSKSETLSMIKNELSQLLPVDLNEYKIIYKQIDTIVDNAVEKGSYIIYGLPITIYNEYIALAERLKLDLVAIDLSSNCLDKISAQKVMLNKQSLKPKTSVAFIDVGYTNIYFGVLNDGKDVFSRISSSGFQDIVRNYQAIYELTQEDAINDIERRSLLETSESISEISKLNIIEDNLNMWIDEFNRYIRYYNSNNKERQIEKIYIYGSHTKIIGIEQYLESKLGISTESINEVSNVIYKGTTGVGKFDIKSYFNTILSLYISVNDINFLTDRKRKHKLKFSTGVVAMAVSLVAVLTLAYYTYAFIVEKNTLEKEIATLDEYINNPENIKQNNEAIDFKNKALMLQTYMDEVEKLHISIKNEDAVNTLIFEQIAASIPAGTRINSMSIDGTSIQMQCTSSTRLEVAQFESNLKQIEFISNVYIPAIVDSEENQGVNYTYSVVCDIKDVIVNEAQ